VTMKELGKWEYDCLKRDMEYQGDKFEYEGGFSAWYEEVFLIDESWEEIRKNRKEFN